MREKTQSNVNMAPPTIDLIVPTFNNPEIFQKFLSSFCRNTFEPWRLIVVNNGDPIRFKEPRHPGIHVVQMPANAGWMGGVNAGVKYALANSPAKFIGWINDDVQIIDHDCGWLTKMIVAFEKKGIGAVGPVSNAVMGYQSSNHIGLPSYIEATRLSGMCFITKREIIEKVGLLDESLPGGDDLDYSIRVRQAGYKLCICRRTFMMHHYAATGKRVHGEYWDSRDHEDAINSALIHKHGFKQWFVTVNDMNEAPGSEHDYINSECQFALTELADELENGKVLDLGCGGRKIHPKAIGVDIRPAGALGVGFNANVESSGEIEADATDLHVIPDRSVDGVIAKHLLEHCINPVKTLREWHRVLKDGGKMVIIVPDWRFCEAIACDPSHTAAYTPDSLSSLLDAVGGFKISKVKEVSPGYVFGISCEKIGAPSVAFHEDIMPCAAVSR